ncbi:MAG: YIP1 family protein, partial [Lachnospiraceae bacterium]|nr:YIP1 family protein [Lachnospiraceae bacterium]
ALTPYPLMQVPLMIISNVITVNERQFYSVLAVLSLVWCGLLIIAAMGQIHEFSGAKNILFLVFSLFAMLVMVFILMLFFSMITQGIGYFYSLYREFMFRA